jgi:hypothetical protein
LKKTGEYHKTKEWAKISYVGQKALTIKWLLWTSLKLKISAYQMIPL